MIAGDGQVTTTPDHPRGAMLRAYNKATGKEVGKVFIPAPQSGSPMSYMLKGKQHGSAGVVRGGGDLAVAGDHQRLGDQGCLSPGRCARC